MDRINIEPIKFGLTDTITAVSLEWAAKPFFGDNLTLKILAFGQDGNLVQELLLEMTIDEYVALGKTKQERADAVLANNGIIKIS